LLPPASPQPVTIHVIEHRVTESQEAGKTIQDLDLSIEGTLKKDKAGAEGSIGASLHFDRIRLSVGEKNRTDSLLRYDSQTDKPGKGNRLADLMAVVADAKLALRVSPNGQLLELRGLDPKWRAAGIVMAPPDLLTAQWLFRDMSMAELVAEALFPPAPDRELTDGYKWSFDLPANIPLTAQFTSHLAARVEQMHPAAQPWPAGNDGPASPILRIAATGQIEPAAAPLKDVAPAIRPAVSASSHHLRLTFHPKTGFITHSSKRVLTTDLTLTPPQGNHRLRMRIHQVRTLEAERGRAVGQAAGQPQPLGW